ncbi:hypothetical protein AB0M95_38975 [Sphaerisporangium sp. NPDC051017]|uniref:ATP-binding protein n=1 Tax=Sphaerisporangium sp. NPDC051017 TaxID=3154636 RepID=UPI00343FF4DA
MADPTVDITVGPRVQGEVAPRGGIVPTGKMVWRRAFAGLAEEAPKARAFVRCLLAGTRWVDDAEFTAAELVNNSLFHSRSGRPGGYFVVEVTRRPRSVRVGVYDLGGGGVPDLKRLATAPPTRAGGPPGDVTDVRQGVRPSGSAKEGPVEPLGQRGNDFVPPLGRRAERAEPLDRRTEDLLDEDFLEEVLREHGRGLDAVTRLALRVGCQGNPVTGHLVWALFADTTPRRRPS